MLSYIAFARYFVISTALATLTGSLPVQLMYKRNYKYYNPEENLGSRIYLTEGDIRVERKRSVESQYFKTWYNRAVPYVFDSKFGPGDIKRVEAAMLDIQNNSCIKFKRRTTESDYLQIIPDSGCYSNVGRTGGSQEVGLGNGCLQHGIIQHELLHALGFWHEQSRLDRDSHVKVMWDNIRTEHRDNFHVQSPAQSQEAILRLPYDYGSVMHYANNTFAIDRQKPTLVPFSRLPNGVVMGQRERFSQGDIDKLNALYRCDIHNCSDPVSLPLGYIAGNDYNIGSKIRYSCQPGTVLVGAPERTCLDVGLWSGDPPACLMTTPGNPIYYCNFDDRDKPLCGWTPGKNDNLPWRRNTRQTPSNRTGPYWDHTLSTAMGGYAYVEASYTHKGEKARLVSPRFQVSSRYRTCLAFFTYMYGENMGNLTVYAKEEVNMSTYIKTESRALISLKGEQGRFWKQIFLVLGEMLNPFYVTIEGSVGNGYMSDIAIDDVIIGDCSSLKPVATSGVNDPAIVRGKSCQNASVMRQQVVLLYPPQEVEKVLEWIDKRCTVGGLQENIECTFDSGQICSFLQDSDDRSDWQITSGRTPTLFTGPSCDPIACQSGKYLYLESSQPYRSGDMARLMTPVLGGRGHSCILFYYSMNGRNIGSLVIKMTNVNSGNEQVLWAKSGHQGKEWHVARVEFMAQEAYMIGFEGTVGQGHRGDIALDTISVTEGRCSAIRRFDCNFEQDMCDWQNDVSPSVSKDWIRHQGHTATPYTGPSGDRRIANGYYIYVEASRSYVGDTARLISPSVPYVPQTQCLTFWYHMYGTSIGNLTVSVQKDTGQEYTLWTLSGDQGNQWISQSLNVTAFDNRGRDFYVSLDKDRAVKPKISPLNVRLPTSFLLFL